MTKNEVIRILKRYVAREVYRYLPAAKSSGCGSGFPPYCRSSELTLQRYADPQLESPRSRKRVTQ